MITEIVEVFRVKEYMSIWSLKRSKFEYIRRLLLVSQVEQCSHASTTCDNSILIDEDTQTTMSGGNTMSSMTLSQLLEMSATSNDNAPGMSPLLAANDSELTINDKTSFPVTTMTPTVHTRLILWIQLWFTPHPHPFKVSQQIQKLQARMEQRLFMQKLYITLVIFYQLTFLQGEMACAGCILNSTGQGNIFSMLNNRCNNWNPKYNNLLYRKSVTLASSIWINNHRFGNYALSFIWNSNHGY